MDEFDDLKLSDSDDDEGAGERVRMIMEEIYKNQDKIKSEKDIEEMAERCTNMMTQMRNEAYLKKKDKKGQRSSGAGDKASPPPSRISSVKESPRRDSTKAASSALFPPPSKSNLKPQMDKKKSQKPNFSELYKEKMEKMRVPGKIDLKGSQTKNDSTKASEAMHPEPLLWGMTKNTSTTLNEAHFKDALDRMKESGVNIKGKEGEASVDRIIKTIKDEESSEESLSDYNAPSKDSDYSDPEILEEEKIAAQKLLKELEKKKEQPLRSLKPDDFRKPYLSWLERETSALRLGGYTTTDGMGTRMKKNNNKKFSDTMDILSDESYPSDASTEESSDVVSDANDPFSQTKEGREIMRKMKQKKPETKKRHAERELKKKMQELRTDGPEPRLSLDGLRAAIRGPAEWCTLARAQAESREQKGWVGDFEVKDIDAMWLRDIREANESGGRGGAME